MWNYLKLIDLKVYGAYYFLSRYSHRSKLSLIPLRGRLIQKLSIRSFENRRFSAIRIWLPNLSLLMPAESFSYQPFFSQKKEFVHETLRYLKNKLKLFISIYNLSSLRCFNLSPSTFSGFKHNKCNYLHYTRLLSYYAFSQGWLLPSPPLSCHSVWIPFLS